jgi:LuxR family transcriptional regulator, maltose regulon positive regulatory protein
MNTTSVRARREDLRRGNGFERRAGVPAAHLHPAHRGGGVVPRRKLVGRMLADDSASIVVLAAPAGYGKTNVMMQWAARQPLPVVWLTADHADNDPLVLLAGIGAGLGWVNGPASTSLTRLVQAISDGGPVLLVLDQLEVLGSDESTAVVTELAARLPPGSRLAIGTRERPPLPMPMLRSRGGVLEVSSAELAMTRQEARLLLDKAGVTLYEPAVDAVVEHTEGWPVALHFAGRAARLWPRGTNGFRFRGDDRLMGDYLRAEVLGGLDEATVTFLTRTSVLDRLAGPLCDAVLESRGSQATLEALESTSVPLIALDHHRGWYRYHHLVRDLLASDLSRHEPALAAALHARAARWFDARRLPEPALQHAQAAGDPERAARLVAAAGASAYISGRAGDVGRWIEWFPGEGVSVRFPNVAILGALAEASLGHPPAAERWTAFAEPGRLREASGRCAVAGWRSYLRAFTCRSGVPRMRTDARRAQRELSPWSPLLPGAILLEGLSFVLAGDPSTADPILAHAHDVAVDVGAMPTAAFALAERALIAAGAEDGTEAGGLIARAAAILEQHGLEGCLEAAIVFAVSARRAIQAGNVAAGRTQLEKASRLRPLLTYAAPWTAQFQLELARGYLELADAAAARAILRELGNTLQQRPNLGTVAGDANEVRAALETIRDCTLEGTSLTVAEFRLLPYLSTHLSFPEIGANLNVSRHTVKTQAISIYRKLGVSSRSDAIRRACQIGLLLERFTPTGG